MQGFRRRRSLQKFAAIQSSVYNHFNLDRHLTSRATFKTNRDDANLLMISSVVTVRHGKQGASLGNPLNCEDNCRNVIALFYVCFQVDSIQ